MSRSLSTILLLAGVLTVQGCAKSRPVDPSEYNDPRYRGPPGSVFGDSSILNLGGKSSPGVEQTGILVNAYLWRAALDTLSFMPLSSADPFGGVIITDWYEPPASPGERFKATAYILGRQLRTDGIRVTVFRQVQQNGQWVDAPVQPSTTGLLEDKVLARARELRAQATAGT